MIKEKEIEMRWSSSNRKRYESAGYYFTNYNDTFFVKIEDIAKKSEIQITAICEYCNKEKKMTIHAYNDITKNKTKKYRCRECFIKQKALKYSDIVEDAEQSGYKIITKENEYKNSYTYIKYICPVHGIQSMKAYNFHSGKRCPKCAKDKARLHFALTPNEVYDKVKRLGGELLNKDDYINQDIKNLKIICPRCKKNVLTTSLKHFKQHGGQSCLECYRKESVGERRIRQWLESNNIIFVQEKWFPDCRDINPLPFDFYLPNSNQIIEFDGEQHFCETHYFSLYNSENSVTSYTKYHDEIKNLYCLSNNINLIRIPYTQINNIENILQEKIIV